MSFLVDCKSQNCGYWNRTDLTTAYFDDIKDYPVLSSNEERKLLERVKSSNPVISENARKKLVECNQRFVVSVARRWQKGDNLMDIVNEERNLPVRTNVSMDELLLRVMDQNFVPVIDDRSSFIGIITRKDIIRYFYDKHTSEGAQKG